MNSVAGECTPLKTEYDECFKKWFTGSFLRGQSNHDATCGRIFQEYQKCLKTALEREGLNSSELYENVLGTDKEKKPDE